MIKYIKQLNITGIVLVASILAISSIMPVQANAAIFDWLSSNQKEISGNYSLTFISSFLNIDQNFAEQNAMDSAGALEIIQNSSLASVASPEVIQTPKKVREMVVSATAYSSTPDQTDDSPFITAWNTHVRDGIIAANFLPFGTKIKIPDIYGNKVFVVEDRMNRRYWHKIDIWFPNRQSALEFGLKTVKIQILES